MTQDAGSDYVARMRAEGFSDDEIRDALQASGWSDEQIEGAMAAPDVAPPPPPPPREEPLAPDSRVERPPIRTKSSDGTAAWVIVLVGCLGLIVAVGAIMAAIMFPVFARAREKATMASCQSNLKMIALAQLMYVQDYDEHFALAPRWPEELYPYMQNHEIFRCPSDERPSPPTWQGYPISYTMSGACSGIGLKAIASPATVPLTYDGSVLVGGVGDVAFRHNEGANCAYTDGHVKWVHDAGWLSSWQVPGAPPPGPTPSVPPPPAAPPAPAPSHVDPMAGADAMERARTSACQSNLKQVALAMLMYAQDYDEAYVIADRWPEALHPYTKNNEL